MDDAQVMRSMVRDDAYHVERVLAKGPGGWTELVTLGDGELLVRKRIPLELENASVWAALMGMNEPRLPHVEEMYFMPDELVVVCSYVRGNSASELVKEEGPLATARACTIVAQVCEAAAALHAADVVHRDITPGNVIVATDGAHLVDLGIARRQRQDVPHDTTVLGTWGFAAPEQFGFAQTDRRSDVYSLGRLLGFLLTGERPDSDEYEKRLDDAALVPPELADIVAAATVFEPSGRYQSAEALREALEPWAEGTAGGQEADAAEDSRRSLWESATRFVPKPKLRSAARKAAPVPPQGPARSAKPQQGAESAPRGNGPRRFDEAPVVACIAAVVVWVLAGGYMLLVALAAHNAITKGDPPWTWQEHMLGVITCWFVLNVSYEVFQAVRLRGRYTADARPLVRLFKQLLRDVAIVVLLFALECVVAVALG